MDLNEYTEVFSHLHTAKVKGYRTSFHKIKEVDPKVYGHEEMENLGYPFSTGVNKEDKIYLVFN